jgi:hypothetical protein
MGMVGDGNSQYKELIYLPLISRSLCQLPWLHHDNSQSNNQRVNRRAQRHMWKVPYQGGREPNLESRRAPGGVPVRCRWWTSASDSTRLLKGIGVERKLVKEKSLLQGHDDRDDAK